MRTTTTSAPAETTTSLLVDVAPEAARPSIRVMVLNGTETAGLARALAETLTSIGYAGVVIDDADQAFELSAVFYRPGSRSQAVRVATDIGFDPRFVLPIPADPLTNDDARGDVIVVVGSS